MAIFSLNHSAVGKTTHAPGTAGAHVRYITRTQAEPDVVANLIPEDRNAARAWILRHEIASRKNARVCDKLIIALPLEFDANQRRAVLKDFADRITEGRAPYFAAIHAAGKDAANPHAHLILVDRDQATGKRVMLTTEKGSTDRFRGVWEETCNAHLAAAGYAVRIDKRTLAAQGIDRTPQIHVGAEGNHVNDNVGRPESRVRDFNNSAGAKLAKRKVDYVEIDKGRTRREFNDEILHRNDAKNMRSPDFATSRRAKLAVQLREMKKRDDQQFAETRRQISRQARADRAEAWKVHRAAVTAITTDRQRQLTDARSSVKAGFAAAWRDHYARKEQDQLMLKAARAMATSLARRGQGAISAMKRGADYIAGHLRPIFDAAANLPAQRRVINHAENERRKAITEQQRTTLRERISEIRQDSRRDMSAEKARYQAERAEQMTALRAQWQDFHRQQKEAVQARETYRHQAESTIAKVDAVSTRARDTWARVAERAANQSDAQPAVRASPSPAPALGRG